MISLLLAFIQPFETPFVKYIKPIQVTELHSGVEKVDCIYVINLDERPQKWARFISQLDNIPIYVNRVSGVNGWSLTEEQRQEIAGPYPIRHSAGHFGCFLSHISILKDAYERGYETIWVMEDDAQFLIDPRQISSMLNELSTIDSDWDVLFTDIDSRASDGGFFLLLDVDARPGQILEKQGHPTRRKRIGKNLMRIRGRYGAYSMLISRSGIKKMLDYYTHVYFWTPIDRDMHYVPSIREYSTVKNLITHRWPTISDTSGESTLCLESL